MRLYRRCAGAPGLPHLLGLVCLACLVAACGTPAQGVQTAPDAAGTDSGSADTVPFADAKVDGGDAAGDVVAGGDFVWLTFQIDDSANQTFADGEIKWTGSFSWDAATNTIVHASSWLPSDGPYPPLYDDGPLSQGGHEMEGATQGDHIFSTQVKFVATETTTLEYGALNELDHWMWQGPNGVVEIEQGKTGVVHVSATKIAKFGSLDLRLTLDTAKLHESFAKWAPATHKFYVKGTMNQWTPVQLLDNGQKGDEAAGDGVLTYVHSLNLGKHDGLLPAGAEVQFIFVTTQGDTFPEDGQEYKGATQAYADGVGAATGAAAGGPWTPAAVVLAKDSKGKFLNTAVKMPGVSGDCAPACGVGEQCVLGTCEKLAGCTPACAAGEQCVAGQCEKLAGCTPACAAGEQCVAGQCVAPLAVTAVEPSKGAVQGGTVVTLTGTGLQAGAKVRFGGELATDVVVVDAKSLTAKTPAHAAGLVEVEVENPDGKKAKLAEGFFYFQPSTEPTLTGLEPAWAPAKGGGKVLLLGENLQASFAVEFVSTFGPKPSAAGTDVTVVDGKGLLVTVPSLPPLPADVVVTAPGKPALQLPAALQLVAFDTPSVDASLGDWDKFSLAALNTVPTAWGEGKNELKLVNVAYDKDNVYFGIQGTVEAANAIVVYVDVDHGQGGTQNPVDLKDNAGAVDDAIASVIKVADPLFGADFAFATLGMAGFDGSDLAASTAAGWRNLANVNDFGWLGAAIETSVDNGVVETAIPLATLYPQGVPAAGATLKWLVVLVNKDGSAVSNQWLPAQDGAPDATTATTFGTLPVFAAP